MVDTWATVGLVRADRRARAPLGWGRHRWRARAAAGRAGRRRRRRASIGSPLHGHAGRAGRRRVRARRGRDPDPGDPGDRRRDGRGGRRAASCRRGRRRAGDPRARSSPAASSACPCALIIRRLEPRASATTRPSSTTSSATTAWRHDRSAMSRTAEAVPPLEAADAPTCSLLTAALVAVPSVSRDEGELADLVGAPARRPRAEARRSTASATT